MERFDVKIENGSVLMPKPILNKIRGRKLVMVFHEGEIRIMSKPRFKMFLSKHF